jgi:OOP family OmpA-OmpF porin
MKKSITTFTAVALVFMTQGAVQAVDFGERTPEVNELVDALSPPRRTRGAVGVAGAAAANKGRASMQIGFELGSSKVLERDLPKLQRLAEALASDALREARFQVVGHTDATGPLSLNMRLSKQRAEAVTAYLVSQRVDAGRLTPEGRGPNELLDRQRPDAAENRRVELIVLK